MRRLIEKLALKLIGFCERTGRVFVITGTSIDGYSVPYMIRYMPFKTKYLSLYIHRFLRSDHDVPHDHPFSFLTYVIKGGYDEVVYNYGDRVDEYGVSMAIFDTPPVKTRRKQGSLAFRKGSTVHKVVLDEDITIDRKLESTLTVCLIGPVYRKWGFWGINGNIGIWTLWTKFLNISDDRGKRG